MVLSPEDRDSAQMRFLELAVDILIGDLKNNFTMASDNGIRRIRGTLTENQIPEIVRAAIDMAVEQSTRYGSWNWDQRDISFDGTEYVYETVQMQGDTKTVRRWKQTLHPMTDEETEAWEDGTFYDDLRRDFFGVQFKNDRMYIATGPEELINEFTAPVTREDYAGRDLLNMPMRGLTINYVHGEAEVDANGDLLSVDVGGTAMVTNIFGDTHEVGVNFSAVFSDIGTSNPVSPIPGAEDLLTADHMKDLFGHDRMGVYFTLNDDGSINADSITTAHPAEVNSLIVDNRPWSSSGFARARVETSVVNITEYDEDEYYGIGTGTGESD
jgi:hypothetical protein